MSPFRTPARRPAARPFRYRLAVSVTALAALVLAVANMFVYIAARRTLAANLDSALLAIARSEIASSLDGPGGSVHVHEDGSAGDIYLRSGRGYEKFAAITDRDGRRVIARTANLNEGPPLVADARALATARAGQAAYGDIRHGGELLRGLYYPIITVRGTPLLALVAIPREPLESSLHALLAGLLLSWWLGTVVAWQLGALLSGRLTRPLERIAAEAGRIERADFRFRLPDVRTDRELQQVTDTLNALLARQEAAWEAQRRFLSDASHELRSPLANLRGAVEVTLRRPRAAEDYAETLSHAQAEIERLSRLVNDLLLLSRADAGAGAAALVRQREPCDLRQLVRASAEAFEPRARTAGVCLHLADDAPGDACIPVDADRLRQAIDNLLDNALRYAPPDSAVRVGVDAAAPDAVRITVRDLGPGMTEEEQRHAFDRFWRADTARARDTGGAGLGLAIAGAITQAHDGSISVQSAPGQGATFTITLPRQVRQATRRDPVRPPPA